jgi:hypothetical protein
LLTFNSKYAIIKAQLTFDGNIMFETLEIRRAANGFILVVNTEDESKEFVYDTERKLMRVVKQHLGEKILSTDAD